jgi:integrase
MKSLVPLGNSDLLLQEQVDHIILEEMEAVKRACEIQFEKRKKTLNREWMRDRDMLLITMLWVTGGRVSDVLMMCSDKLSFKDNKITFVVKKRKSKKKKAAGVFWHEVTLDPATLGEIADYVNKWHIRGYLFPSRMKATKPMTRQRVNEKIDELTEIIGMRHLHPHQWRHGLAMHLQRQGVPIEVISFHLAHSGTSITLSTYARMSASQEKSMLETLGAKLR